MPNPATTHATADSTANAAAVLEALGRMSHEASLGLEADSTARLEADSLAAARADSLRLRPWDARVSTFLQSPLTPPGEGGNGKLAAWQMGLPPYERAPLTGYDSGVMTVVVAVFLLLAACSRHASTFIKNFAKSLFKTHRESIFDDHTLSETRIQTALMVLLWVCEGAVIFTSLRLFGIYPKAVFAVFAGCTAVAAAYYIWQLVMYNLVGYTFGQTPQARVQWVKGFNASQILLGLALVVPMLVGLFAPGWGRAVVVVSVILYLIARLIFIAQGFRVFYARNGGLLYFILYLCTLEMAPLVVLVKLRFLAA